MGQSFPPMLGAGTTLFVEQLGDWVRAAPALRLPALESVVWRGTGLPSPATPAAFPDAIRFALLGGAPSVPVPAGALAATAAAGETVRGHWLRADPVTLRAGLTQVYLAGIGFADYTAGERTEVAEAVRAELGSAGLEPGPPHPGFWTLRLPGPLDFEFTPVARALGSDIALHLPGSPAARNWRRLMNDLQVVLHNLPLSERRRKAGRAVVNGVWFWGAGELPFPPPPAPFTRIFADQPVSAGMARWYGLDPTPQPLAGLTSVLPDETVFIDWMDEYPDAAATLARLDAWVAARLRESVPAHAPLRIYSGAGQGWQGGRGRAWFGWNRLRPLAAAIGAAAADG